MKARYKALLTIGVLIVVSGLAAAFLPWKTLLANRMISALKARGLQEVHFVLSGINLRGAVFQDIAIGEGRPFTLGNLAVRYSPQADEISADADDMRFGKGDLKASAPKASAHAKNGEGDWSLQGLQAQSGDVILPVISGGGKLKYASGVLLLSGQFKSADKTYLADFSLDYPFEHSGDAQLKLIYASMPWKGGTLATKNAIVPLGGRQPVKLLLQIRRVSTDALLQAMTGTRVTATGTVSGSLPLIIEPEGVVSFGKGSLKADGAGRISLPPEAIPGGNEQVTMVRDILKNFHYQGFSMSVNSDKNQGVSLLIALEGNNPDMYNGRPVKLNVRLAGDVLGYIRQNVLLLTSPETLLKQGQK